MIGIVGTVPDDNFPLVHGKIEFSGDKIKINNNFVSINRCTLALMAAALKVSETVKCPEIYGFLVGDTGKGYGSRKLYEFLTKNLSSFDLDILTFHYLQPDVDWHNKILFAIEDMKKRPVLIADAGFMYAAKMSGQALSYDFFTPDAGELAFLADELAPHPFYTRGFILSTDEDLPLLVKRAYKHENAARNLIVKGKTDYIVKNGEILKTLDSPSFDSMEAIGGTGDTITGILTALLGAGFDFTKAGEMSCLCNRIIAELLNPTPATQVAELIDKIPEAMLKILDGKF
ncbi:MAG: NAD(P)H-hydrate dehydratase [Desulforegulaceae bacterium]|nr:NAD(P)H-hydrate dehydratase [Desulforegulaceae bacterium]